MSEAYDSLLEVALQVAPELPHAEYRALHRAIDRAQGRTILKMAIWRDDDYRFPGLVNIATVRNGELAGEVLRDCCRTYAAEIVTAWNAGNRRYAVSMLNSIRANNLTYAIRH